MPRKGAVKLGWQDLGEFEVPQHGQIGVWDPCYGDDRTYNAVPGTWVGSVQYSDEGDWGVRCKRLCAALKGHTLLDAPFEKAGVVGVDSGQMGIYAVPLMGGPDTADADYDVICKKTLAAAGAGLLPYGVVSSSGYGDGGYQVYVRRDQAGSAVEVLVDFIPDEDESE